MDDLISRQAAMDEMSKQQTYKMFVGEDIVYLDANDVGSVLASLPSAQQWIPCSERLPEEDGDYLVTDDGGGMATVNDCFFCRADDGEPLWCGSHVVAWMPLPDCYQGDEK